MFGHELEDDRPRRRDRACLFGGLLTGATVGALAGASAPSHIVAVALVGIVVGGLAGKLLAAHISADEWDPRFNQRPHVGTSSPDDDVTRSSPTARP
jgi:hypothetical protein